MPEEKDYNPDLLTVSDDDGNEHVFEVLDRIETDAGKYIAVLPTFDSEEEYLEADVELIPLRVKEEDGDTFLYAIEDDQEFDEIADIFEERLSDVFEITEEEISDTDEEEILN
ncbi:MAG TPA: DUF1292 domain-containing protein [Clostridiales bacterium]|nr:DUF1292 domain-containing protein [Clostridiales bacterium]